MNSECKHNSVSGRISHIFADDIICIALLDMAEKNAVFQRSQTCSFCYDLREKYVLRAWASFQEEYELRVGCALSTASRSRRLKENECAEEKFDPSISYGSCCWWPGLWGTTFGQLVINKWWMVIIARVQCWDSIGVQCDVYLNNLLVFAVWH